MSIWHYENHYFERQYANRCRRRAKIDWAIWGSFGGPLEALGAPNSGPKVSVNLALQFPRFLSASTLFAADVEQKTSPHDIDVDLAL